MYFLQSCATHLDRNGGVESGDRRLKRLEGEVLVGEDAELDGVLVHAERDAGRHVLFVGAEPGVPLRLLEEPVEERIVSVVVHRHRAGPATRRRGRGWDNE